MDLHVYLFSRLFKMAPSLRDRAAHSPMTSHDKPFESGHSAIHLISWPSLEIWTNISLEEDMVLYLH